MGRTVPSFRIALEHERQEWADFRKCLDKQGKTTFDKIFQLARLHVSSCMMCCRPVRLDCILMAVLLEHHKQLLSLFVHEQSGK